MVNNLPPYTNMSTKTPETASKPVPNKYAKLEQLAKTTEFAWFVGHVGVLLGTLFSLVFAGFARISNFEYRFAYLSAIVSFAIIIRQKYSVSGVKPTVSQLFAEDNVHYIGLAVVMLFTRKFFLTLLPFAIFSFFHALTYIKSYILPAIDYTGPATGYIDRIVKGWNEPLTAAVASIETVVLFQLIFSALTFRKGSWIQLLGFLAFFRLRFASSPYTRNTVRSLEVRADNLLGHPSLPPAIKQYWIQFKSVIARIPGPATPVSSTAH